MGVKLRSTGKWQVDLKGRYVGVYSDERTARQTEAAGKRQLELGKPLNQVIAELRGSVKQIPSLDAHAARWLSSLTISQASIDKYACNYERVSRIIGRTPLDRITTSDVRRTVSSLSKAGYSPKTVRVSIATLKAVLSDAVDAGLLDHSPATRIPNMPKAARTREPHALTREEYTAIVKATKTRWRPLVAFWPLVGLRVSELIALRRKDIDLEARTLRVEWQRTGGKLKRPKTARSRRTVDLSPAALDLLTEQLERWPSPKRDLVFAGVEGGYLRYDAVGEIFSDIRESTSIPLRPHDMRHTFGSWLIASGADIAYVSSQLGHHSPAFTLQVYIHELGRQDDRAVRKRDEWLKGTEQETSRD
jgi:integrase